MVSLEKDGITVQAEDKQREAHYLALGYKLVAEKKPAPKRKTRANKSIK